MKKHNKAVSELLAKTLHGADLERALEDVGFYFLHNARYMVPGAPSRKGFILRSVRMLVAGHKIELQTAIEIIAELTDMDEQSIDAIWSQNEARSERAAEKRGSQNKRTD
jgi:hypothetical protein